MIKKLLEDHGLLKDYYEYPDVATTGDGEPISITDDEAIQGVLSIMSEDKAVKSIKAQIEYNYHGKDKNSQIKKSVDHFMHECGMNQACKSLVDMSWGYLAEETGFSEEFLKWYAKEMNFSDRQMLCHHDDTDSYSSDGNFYNSTGVCKKCLISMNDTVDQAENIEIIYKARTR